MKIQPTLSIVGLVTVLAACGGGGNPTADPVADVFLDTDNDGIFDSQDAFPKLSGVDLQSFADTISLQSLSLGTTSVDINIDPKSATKSNWTTASTDYVITLNNSDVVGIAMSNIPASIAFSGIGTANIALIDASTQYKIINGDVSAN